MSLLAHIGHLEFTSPDVEASVAFYTTVLGMKEYTRRDGKVYLRCWGDYYTYSVVIGPGAEPALVNMAWRTTSDAALDEAVANIEAAGSAGEWVDNEVDHGRTYRFVGPYGHPMKLYWEQERFAAQGDEISLIPDRPSRRSNVGASPRYLDHITVTASDVTGFTEWYRDVFGFRIMAYSKVEHINLRVFGVITTNEKSHDLGVLLDGSGVPGRMHHYAYWVDTREDLNNVADIVMENGVPMESGPGIHGIGEQTYLYFREPGSGLRVEVNTGGYRNYVPDWTPNDFDFELALSIYRNSTLSEAAQEAFPAAAGPVATEEGVFEETIEELARTAGNH
jgi:catechol 2,3-dioxygenase